jgi:PAS domain S-box-containing protein
MKDKDKAQKQPTKELTQLRKRVAEREASEQERKEAKEALKKNEHDKAAVLDSISELVVYHDTKMRIQWVNKAASESVGFDPQQLVGRHCYEIWQQRRKPCLGCPVVKAHKSGRSQEAEMTSPDGRVWLVRGYPVQDAKGNVKGAVEVTSDITERKRAEEALREERDQAQQYLDIAEVMFVALNKKGEITLINRKGNQILGYKEGELLGKNWPASCVPSYLRKGVKGVFRKLMAGEGKTTEFYENPVLTKSGTERIIAWHNTLLKDATGNIIGTLSSGEDITERKQAEEELRKSEGRFRTLVETMKVGLNTIDENGVITYVNDQFCSMLGYSMDDMVGHPNFDFLDEENRQTLECLFAKRKKGEQDPAPYELTWLRKDGQKVHTIMSPTPFFDRGGHHEIRYTGAYAIITDITELKQTEEALKESEEKYRDLINGMNDTAWVINFEGKFIDANNAAVAVLGYSREELLSMGPSDIDGTLDAEAIKTLIKQMPTDKIQVFETTHTTKDGTVIPVEIKSSLITYQGKRAILSIARDITERKQGEAALEQTRLLLEAVLEQSPVPIVVVSGPDLVVRYKNRAAIDFLGVTDEPTYLGLTLPQVKRRQTWQDLNPDGTPTDLLNLPLARALRGETTRNEEYGVIRKDGTQRWELVSGTPIYSRSGELVAGLVVFPDITERKQSEEKLRESESRYRTLFDSAGDAIFILDITTGRFIDANRVACERLGYSRKELLQMTPTDIDSPEYIPVVQERIETLRQRGHLFFETVHVRRDGTFIPTEMNSQLITHAGKPAVLSIARDITDRREAEKELRHSYQELHEMLITTVNALASTVEMKDLYTAGHQPRVTHLACAIAEEMGLSQYRIEGIRMAGAIHDIGKIVVPAEILNKPGPLTEIQYEMIKMHPRAGYEIVKGIKFPWPVAQIVLQHHELMDGSGYPDGLTGEQIALEARILTVANVVEAMTSHRPYRPALGMEKALEEITKNKGILYDATVVDACLKLLAEKRFTFD